MAEYAMAACVFCISFVKMSTLFFNRFKTASVLESIDLCIGKQIKNQEQQLPYLKNANQSSEFIRKRVVNFMLVFFTIVSIAAGVGNYNNRTIAFR